MRQAVLIAGCAALLIPAASHASTPEGRDYVQPLGPVESVRSAADGERVFVSHVLSAPARFDLAGLEGERRHTELRGRVRGGEWTDWTETANGDPVWFGGMDELQLRTHDWKPSGRIRYVSVTDGGPSLTSRAGDDGMPKVVSRRKWGANRSEGGCIPRQRASYGKVKAGIVHHTVTAVNYAESEAPGMVLGICRYHRNGNGWDDIGYQALVDRYGNIYAGRAGGLGRAVIGAQAQGVNSQTTGVAVLGTHTSTPITKATKKGLAKWLAWKLPQHGRDAEGKARLKSAGGSSARYPAGTRFKVREVTPHRTTNLTECPGDALNNQVGKLRRKVKRKIAKDGGGGGSGGKDGGGISR